MSAASGCFCSRAASAAAAAEVRPRAAAAAKFWIVGRTLVRLVRPGRFCRVGADDALVALEEGVARALQVAAAGFFGQLLGLVDVDLEEVAVVLGAGLVAVLFGDLVVVGERLLGRFEVGGEHHVGVAVLGGPLDRVAAHDPGDPDLRVRVLERPRPGVHVAVLVVLTLPAEGAGCGPGLDHEVVRLLEAFPVEGGLGVVRDAFAPTAADPAGDQPTLGDHVDLGQRLGQPEGVLPDRQDVAEQDDLGLRG